MRRGDAAAGGAASLLSDHDGDAAGKAADGADDCRRLQGLANAYAWDVVWVRVITVLLTVFGGGSGLLAYIIFWIVMPEEPLILPPGMPGGMPPPPPYQPPS